MSIARLQLLAVAVAVAGLSACVPPVVIDNHFAEIAKLQKERVLINRRPVFTFLAQYEPRTRQFTDTELSAKGSLLMVHIWSIHCPPCLAELPLLPDVIAALRRRTGMRMVFIAEDQQAEMEKFFREHATALPRVEQYIISSESRLRPDLDESSQPLTLLLDDHLVVRDAFIGPLIERRNDLQAAAIRLSSSQAPSRYR